MAGDSLLLGAQEYIYLLDCLAEVRGGEAEEKGGASSLKTPREDANFSVLLEIFAEVKERGLWGVAGGKGAREEGGGEGGLEMEGIQSLLSSCLAVGASERAGREEGELGEGEQYWNFGVEVMEEVYVRERER